METLRTVATPAPLDMDIDLPSIDDTTRFFLPQFAANLPPRVLIVDDDPLMLERLEAIVTRAGFDASTADSSRAALRLLQTEHCPIVISDWAMPDMDGLELCRAVRSASLPGYTYMLLLTARDTQQDIVTGLDAGADEYLSKRVTEAELVARLRAAKRIVALEQSLRDMLDEKRRQSTTDPLTSLHNRRYFDKHLDRELKRVRRFGGALSVLAIDIDHFKSVNDRYGHHVGDEVLVQVGARIAAALPRDYDWCARTGGEEFVVVLPQTEASGAGTVAEKLRAAVGGTQVHTVGGTISVTMSIGVASLAGLPSGPEIRVAELLARADRALYASKQCGRNRVTAAKD